MKAKNEYEKQPEYDPAFVDWDDSLRFELDEACALLNRECVRNRDSAFYKAPPADKAGIIVGVLTMNEEIELLIKFLDGMEQVVKSEFCGDYILSPDF